MVKYRFVVILLLLCSAASIALAQDTLSEPTKTLIEVAEYPTDKPDSHEAYKAALEALAAGADVNAKQWGNETILMTAVKSRNLKMVQLLLERGADIEAQDNSGETALMIAAREPMHNLKYRPAYAEILKYLLKQGAQVNVQDEKGSTALSMAAYHGHAEHVKLLLAKGADVNLIGAESGWPPLVSASYNGHTEVVRLLLEAGAVDRDRQTALSVATQQGHTEIVRMLSAAMARGEIVSGGGSENRVIRQPVYVDNPAPVDSRSAITEKPCYLCNGGGACNWCYGSGRSTIGDYACVKCYGSGKCTNCGGSGRVKN